MPTFHTPISDERLIGLYKPGATHENPAHVEGLRRVANAARINAFAELQVMFLSARDAGVEPHLNDAIAAVIRKYVEKVMQAEGLTDGEPSEL